MTRSVIPRGVRSSGDATNVLAWFRKRQDLARRAEALHAAVVDRARAPHLYVDGRVPDTVDGRFEMVVLHLVLAGERLKRIGAEGEALSRALNEAFVVAMDDTMRAIGVGDLSVPGKVKKAAAALYDRHTVYAPLVASRAAPDAWQSAFTTTLAAADPTRAADLAHLAAHAVTERDRLAAQPDTDLLAGRL